jgi:hypothetical protein
MAESENCAGMPGRLEEQVYKSSGAEALALGGGLKITMETKLNLTSETLSKEALEEIVHKANLCARERQRPVTINMVLDLSHPIESKDK